MASSANPLSYQYYQPPVTNAGYNTTNNPRQLVSNADEFAVNTGGQLLNQDQALANQYGGEQAGVQSYLNPLEETNASGQGGYSPSEASQIELTPGQQQDIVTSAGISAGAGNAAAVNAAERAYAASGGNPAALATYRARAAQSQASNAGQAETGAKVAAQQAGSAGAQAVGNATLAQENQGLGYFGNEQAQLGSEAQTEQGLGQSSYQTETGALTGGLNAGVNASQTPTTADKIIGGVAGAAGAAGLADGRSYFDDDGQDAVVGENGIEAVIENAPKAVQRGASDPVRSHTTFMDEGRGINNDPPFTSGGRSYLDNGVYGAGAYIPGAAPPPVTPVMSPVAAPGAIAPPSPQAPTGTPPSTTGMPQWLQTMLANQGKSPGGSSPQPGQPGWNKTTPYSQLGTAVGKIAAPYVQKALQPTPPSGPSTGFAPGSSQMPMAGDTDDPGAPGYADGRPSYLDDGAPEQEEYKEDPQNSSEVSRLIASESMAADGKMMAGGRMGSGFHWTNRLPHAPHVPAGGYQPLGYHGKPMLADGSQGFADPAVKTMLNKDPAVQYLQAREAQDREPQIQKYMDDAYDAQTTDAGKRAAATAGVAQIDKVRAQQAVKPGPGRGGYPTPAPKPHMADGSIAEPQGAPADLAAVNDPMAAQGGHQMPAQSGRVPNGAQVGAAKVFNKPTLIHLEKADAVVPLSYRPKAKVRPSAAMPALMHSALRPQHPMGARV